MPRESITTQKLSSKLYLSGPTVLKTIKDCQKDWINIIFESLMKGRMGFIYLIRKMNLEWR